MEFWILGSILAIYIIVMVPIQYRNIADTTKELQRSGKTHNETYDDMSFQEQQMQFNLQGNPINLPASLIAQLIYSLRHRRKRVAK